LSSSSPKRQPLSKIILFSQKKKKIQEFQDIPESFGTENFFDQSGQSIVVFIFAF